MRLSCQVKVKRDMRILVPEELFSIREYKTEVVSIRDLTYDIKEVTLKLKDPPEIDLRPGQYVQFVVPAYELTPEPVYRAYSVSSPPSRKDTVELEIRLVPNGICTTYVFQHLKVGDAVTINGPYGDFYLRDSDREIVFVAGGSGMAPIKSMLLDMAEKGIRRKATYFFGARAVRDLFLVDEMRALEKRLPDFRFVPALSSPLPEDNWDRGDGPDHRGARPALRAAGQPRGVPLRQPRHDRRRHQGVQGEGPAGRADLLRQVRLRPAREAP